MSNFTYVTHPSRNFETEHLILIFLNNVILIVAIKGFQKRVPREDDAQWSITSAFRITFDRTCKVAVDFPLISVNYLVVAVQFGLIPNVLQCIANYWGEKNLQPLLNSPQVQAMRSLCFVCVSRGWQLLRAVGLGYLDSSWHHGTSSSCRERPLPGPIQHRELGSIILPYPEDPIPFSRLIHPREPCFPDTAPLFCPRCEASAKLLFTYVNTRP